jgi:hypothetical protein
MEEIWEGAPRDLWIDRRPDSIIESYSDFDKCNGPPLKNSVTLSSSNSSSNARLR